MLDGYPVLKQITLSFDELLTNSHPQFFGASAVHPFSALKPYKVIHDPLWGTNRFSWRELVLIDSPLFQRLRNIHQTGLAHYVYPSAQHTRFEHSLGVATIAARIFDAINQRHAADLQMIAKTISPDADAIDTISRLRQELRLAALLHDTGHSLYSHASERVYSSLGLMRKAVEELSTFVGREKGAGEVISFCLARTEAVAGLLSSAEEKILKKDVVGEFSGEIDLDNVALLIVGRSRHPFLQFMGDIISSGFDADKLDYLLRDATTAGLPLRYDLERYLYTVYLDKGQLADDEGHLERLYESANVDVTKHRAVSGQVRFPYYDTYRLKLPKQAMSTIEQIVICKLMLFSYIYHHQKVRASEGLLANLLEMKKAEWVHDGWSDEKILCEFLQMTDGALGLTGFTDSKTDKIVNYSYRIINRLVPREIYRISASMSHAEGALIKNFFSDLEDRSKRAAVVSALERSIGEELIRRDATLGKSPEEALRTAGTWVDVPKVPRFENMDDVIGRTEGTMGVAISDVFPIAQWTQAYEAHRFYVRIYAFSEFSDLVDAAARVGMERVIGVKGEDFYRSCRRMRQ